jgi:hypothetical protein
MVGVKRQATKGQKMTTQTTETKLKPVRLDLDPDTHHLLRLVAADEGEAMAQVAREWVAARAVEEAKRRGFKL